MYGEWNEEFLYKRKDVNQSLAKMRFCMDLQDKERDCKNFFWVQRLGLWIKNSTAYAVRKRRPRGKLDGIRWTTLKALLW